MTKKETKQNIIKELGIQNLSSKKIDNILAKLEKNIQRKIVLTVLENFTDEQKEAFDKVLKIKSKKKTDEFISSTIPNMQEFIKNVAVATIEEFKKLSVA